MMLDTTRLRRRADTPAVAARRAPDDRGALVAGAALLAVPLLAAIGGAPLPTEPGHWFAASAGAALLTVGLVRRRRARAA
jgi:hypothetical protein